MCSYSFKENSNSLIIFFGDESLRTGKSTYADELDVSGSVPVSRVGRARNVLKRVAQVASIRRHLVTSKAEVNIHNYSTRWHPFQPDEKTGLKII